MFKIIQKRLESKLGEEVSATQAGFRKSSSTRDHVANDKPEVCFKDHSKAFDCVSHSQLWATLIKMGFPYRERI